MKKIPTRWLILVVLFFSAVVNYIDRNVLSFVMIDDTFKKDMLDWAAQLPLTQDAQNTFKIQMGYVDAIFKACYAVGFILTGWLIDRFLLRKGFGISITLWSLAGVMAAFVGSIKGLGVARGLLAVGESGNMPAATKTIGEWFPQKERSLAFGFFTAAGNIGIILTAWFVPYLSLHYGWQFCFLITGLLGFLVLMSWLWIYYPLKSHPRLAESEKIHIVSGQTVENQNIKISWKQLLGYRQTWAFAVGKFLTDPIFWIYLTWLPDFFNSNEALDQKLDLKNIGLPFLIIYLVTDMGAIFFGWLSSFFISKGWSVNTARKTTMLLAALCVVPIVLAAQTQHLWLAIALISMATAAHQGWSANLFTSVTDMFPRQVTATVTGIGGAFGAVGGIILAFLSGIIRVQYGYFPLFVVAACAYLLALGIIHILVPKIEQIQLKQ